jgi:ATP-dependent helicase/nuclease subunit B
VSPLVLGELCHDTLRGCYRKLIEAGWPQKELTRDALQAAIDRAAGEVCDAYAEDHGTGHALIWQLAQETVVSLVAAMLEADGEEFRASGFLPVRFEVEAEGSLEAVEPAMFKGLRVQGRMDRVDRRAEPAALRVMDYKYRHGSGDPGADRDLVASAVRGFRLQPPLYALMTPEGTSARPESVELVFLMRKPSPRVERARFESSAWNGPAGGLLKKTVKTLVDGIREGRYVIVPDGYCDHCEFSTACRRFHGPTWWRAYSSSPANLLRQLRKQKVPHE